MAAEGRKTLEERLGFTRPPHRPHYEHWRTDYGIGALGLHWVMQIMHLPAYAAARFNVVAGCDIVEERIQETGGKGYGIGHITRDWRELVRMEDVELVDCTFGHAPEKLEKRLEVVEACAEEGKHLQIHKPVAHSLEMAHRMAAAAAEGDIWLAVNQNCRYNPACYSIKQLLTRERLGRPNIIEVRNYWHGRPRSLNDETPAWIGHSIHHADLVRWWVEVPCTLVFAETGAHSTMAIYEFENGTTAYHMENHSGVKAHETYMRVMAEKGVVRGRHNWNWHFGEPGDYELVDVYPSGDDDGVRLPLPRHIYEPHWSDINPFEPRKGPWYDLAGPVAGMMGSMGSLMRGIELNEPPDNHINGALDSLRMCLAAVLSAETGKAIDPRELPEDFTV